MENKKIFVNFKMHFSEDEVSCYLQNIRGKIKCKDVVFFPSNLYSYMFLKEHYKVGLQNIYKENVGAYTGEVSAYQASSMGIEYALIGHSERRNLFHEKNSDIAKKICVATENDVTAVLCVGETKKERLFHREKKVVKKQIKEALKNIKTGEYLILAYEPIWAIGGMESLCLKEIEAMVLYIRKIIQKYFPNVVIPILYGGSIHEENIKELLTLKEVDGFLIGSASLDFKKLLKIIEVAVPM